MRFIAYGSENGPRCGLVVDDKTILDLAKGFAAAQGSGLIAAGAGTPTRVEDIIVGGATSLGYCQAMLDAARDGGLADACVPADGITLLAPIPRPAKNVFCVGSNYRAHVTESSRAQAKEDKAPEYPVFFTKPPTAVIGPGGAIRLDPAVSDRMDYEVELAVIIGKPGRNIRATDAIGHIFGFTIVNDVTARDLQRRHGGQFLKGKGLDTCCPMGPAIVTIDEFPDLETPRISLSVNGEPRQDSQIGNMIFPIPRLLESLSEGLTLEPGDILATGTPSGVGYAMDPPYYLKDGDVITCEIEGIGQLTNVVRKVQPAATAA